MLRLSVCRQVNDAFNSINNRKSLGVEHKGTGNSMPNIQVISISNPQNSYERFLTPIAVPVLLSIVLSSAVICAIGRFFEEGNLCDDWIKKNNIFISSDCFPLPTIYNHHFSLGINIQCLASSGAGLANFR
jgi:ABC-2 type transport system permease protein